MLVILMVGAFLVMGSVYAREDVKNQIVFSETNWVDVPMGADGSWIEIYNRGKEKVDVGGYTIVGVSYPGGVKKECDFRELFTFPVGQVIGPKCMAFVRFDKDVTEGIEKHRFYAGNITYEVPANPPEGEFVRLESTTGCCVLFKSVELNKKSMVDFLRWGQVLIKPDQLHWAVEKGLWESKGPNGSIAVGVAPRFGPYRHKYGTPPTGPRPRVLQRLSFAPEFDGRKSWALLPNYQKTPGKGNPYPAPPHIIARQSRKNAEVLVFGWGVPYNLPQEVLAAKGMAPESDEDWDKFEKWPKIGLLQISKDPQFERVIVERKIRRRTRLRDHDIRPGWYYARIRLKNEQIQTDWSRPQGFKVEPVPYKFNSDLPLKVGRVKLDYSPAFQVFRETTPAAEPIKIQIESRSPWFVEPKQEASQIEWEKLAAVMKENDIPGLRLPGGMTDKELPHLKKLPDLKALDCSGTKVTGKVTEYVTHFRSLKILRLFSIPVTDEGIKDVAQLKGLRVLWLGQTKITDRGLKYLSKMDTINRLRLYDTSIQDEGIKYLRRMRNLQNLDLSRTEISGSGLEHLTKLDKLRVLDLNDTNVGDDALQHVGKMVSLQRLDLGDTKITDAGLQYLSQLNKLRELNLMGTSITDQGLQHLETLDRLRAIRLRNTRVTDEGERAFRKEMPRLSQ